MSARPISNVGGFLPAFLQRASRPKLRHPDIQFNILIPGVCAATPLLCFALLCFACSALRCVALAQALAASISLLTADCTAPSLHLTSSPTAPHRTSPHSTLPSYPPALAHSLLATTYPPARRHLYSLFSFTSHMSRL